jgi:D-alanyl-D-alanine carboxypeptidase (penicillin-binding protein 5/6)
MIRISSMSAAQNGTTAELKEGKYIQLFDLFYGAMLPSGNDAALLLAEVFGLLLFYETVKPESKDYSEI